VINIFFTLFYFDLIKMKTSGCVSGSMLANNAAVAEWCRQPLANA